MELTGKGNDILDKAEDVILHGVGKLLDTPEKMTEADCRSLQTLVCAAGRIQAIRCGSFHSNYPDGQKETAPTPEAQGRKVYVFKNGKVKIEKR